MKCRFCGRTNPEGAQTCAGCGANLKDAPATPAEPAPPATSTPPAQPASPPPSVSTSQATRQDLFVVRYAGFWRRLAAFLIDYLLLGAALSIIALFWFYPRIATILPASGNPTIQETTHLLGVTAQLAAVELLIYWLYFAFMESSRLRGTVGKAALGIQVTDASGNRISFARATGRFFAKIASAIILLIGFIMAAFTSKKQALHDILADTLVVIKPKYW